MAAMRPLVTVNDVAHAELYEHLESVPSAYRAERIRMLATMALRGESFGDESTRQAKSKPHAKQDNSKGTQEEQSGHGPGAASPQGVEVDQDQEQGPAEEDSHDAARRELINGVTDGW